MTITLRPTRWTIGLAIIIALGIGALVYAATQQHDQTTGTFSLDAEGANILVETLDASTGELDPAWGSCAHSGDPTDWVAYCLVRVTNTKVSGPLNFTGAIAEYTGGSNLAADLAVDWYGSETLTTCTPGNLASWGNFAPGGTIGALSGFGNPATPGSPGSIGLGIGAHTHVCMVVTLADPPAPESFGQSLTAVLRIISNDAP